VALRLKVRVSKGNPTVEGGGRVVVSLGGQPVDTLPFYMDPADDDITFYKFYELPMNLNAGASPLLRAVIEPDRLVTDPDLANNTVSVPMDIQQPTLPDEGTDNAARIVSLSVHSEFGDGVAKAGANLTLRAQVAGGGGRTRITYEVNGAEVDVRGVTTSKPALPPSSRQTGMYRGSPRVCCGLRPAWTTACPRWCLCAWCHLSTACCPEASPGKTRRTP
jgi:hypothetical protein